jgi:UDP-N-acetylmuramoyl-L-alanyl-D-glutamate--2,6-diaminopimelate ligase
VVHSGGHFQRKPTSPVPLADICALLEVAPQDAQITGVTLDSTAVQPGDLLAALPGARTHGARYALQAVESGAAGILTDADGAALLQQVPVPVIVVDDPRSVLGEVSALVYGYPAQHLRTFAVTGTNGKTTVTYMLAAALRSLGQTTGMIGTTGTWVGDQRLDTVRTTPEAPDVQAILAMMVQAGITAVAMEVSSHALVLGRVDGLVFDVSAFTNLSPDHLDFHTDMQDYFRAKASLFTAQRTRQAVVNVDDQWGVRLAQQVTVPHATYGLSHGDWAATDVVSDATGSHFTAVHGSQSLPVRVGSPGRFNVANALCTVAMLVRAGYPAADVGAAIATFTGVPGRMEVVRTGDPGPDMPAVIVDYAHTPEAVRGALLAVRELTQGKIWCVLGCGGDRDAIKRPAMGRMAAQGADQVVVTDDNPRSEDPASIRQAVLDGAQEVVGAQVEQIGDRAQAIATAIGRAGPQDTVMILGKGHETGQEIAGRLYPFDDRVVAREVLERKS